MKHIQSRLKPFCLLVVFFISTPASAWQSHVSTDYVMGDADSRISARNNAYEALKVEAARQAQTYIQTTTKLEGDDISESIKIIGASLISISDKTEHFSLSGENNGVLRVEAKATVDDDSLKNRIRAIQRDQVKARQIKQLAVENSALRRLLRATKADPGSPAPSEYDQLVAATMAQRDAFVEITANIERVNQIFERGTLIDMAADNKSQSEKAFEELQAVTLKAFGDSTVDASIQKVVKSGEGYNVFVAVRWKLPVQRLYDQFSRYLDVRKESDVLLLRNPGLSFSESPVAYAAEIYEKLLRMEAVIEVSVAGKRYEIPVLYASTELAGSPCSPYAGEIGLAAINSERLKNRPDKIQMCLVDGSKQPRTLRGLGEGNPIIFHLTASQAEKATSVEASILIRTPQLDRSNYL